MTFRENIFATEREVKTKITDVYDFCRPKICGGGIFFTFAKQQTKNNKKWPKSFMNPRV